jgi:hypothetical protein
MASASNELFTDDEILRACGGQAALFEEVAGLRAELAAQGVVYPALIIGTDGQLRVPGQAPDSAEPKLP